MTTSDAQDELEPRAPATVPPPPPSASPPPSSARVSPPPPPSSGPPPGPPEPSPPAPSSPPTGLPASSWEEPQAPPRPEWAWRLRRQRRITLAMLVVLVALGSGLATVGWSRVRASTPGRYVDPSLGADEPGYVAVVTPTSTMLVVHRSDDVLVGVTLLALRSQDGGGSVIVMPVATRSTAGDEDRSLAAAYAEGGAEAVARVAGEVLHLDVGTPVELDDDELASLLEPVAPLAIDLDQDVGYWPAGEVGLSADQAGAFLAARRQDETELGRLPRQEDFWQAWVGEIGSGGADAIPGEDDVGLGRFLRGLASGPLDVASLPVVPVTGAEEEQFEPDETMVAALVANHVPYPREPSPGGRVRVRLLNGTGETDLNVQVVPVLVTAGAEIALSGNADSFAESETRFLYASESQREEAEALRDALGVGVVEASGVDEVAVPGEESERVDVTVILGADASAATRRSESPD